MKRLVLSNYELLEKIAETPQATIYKACSKKDAGRPLALKLLTTDSLSDSAKAQIRQRIEHLRVLDDALLITPISFIDKDGSCFIVQDYFDGIGLHRFMEARPGMSLDQFFAVAIRLAQALGKAHDAGIIHGGIKPHNILVSDDLDVRLIDFITTVDVRDISHFIYDRRFIRDTLAYTSPEQTGRINHRVVFSSDLYSLGIVFYEMLTGEVPFLSDDPLELIHQHLAREAPPVRKLNPEVPAAISNIVAKLMLKEPEKRYQSSQGLLDDLRRCRDEHMATGTVHEFPLERSVYTHRVAFISKMVGRDEEAEIILGEYEEVTKGEFRSLFISGLSGIGKTRLIQELQKPIVKHNGYFTSGKFDVYQRNIPYSSLIQAFSGLVRTFLTESDERVAMWRGRILDVVGVNGKVLTDVIPELEVLIGIQPDVPALPPVESLNRFHDVFDRFLGCLASGENPLTLFIDDLQWCDFASFDFLGNLFSNHHSHPYLFFIGAYRHNEVDPGHPLTRLVRDVTDADGPLKEVRLGPLRPEHCHDMVAYILESSHEQTKALSHFISTLTEGNPLFVSESLSYLHNEKLLYLDGDGRWGWDLDRIRRSRMPTTVVALFISKIRRFPPDLIALLEYCACMGNTFSPSELSLITERSLLDVFETLKPALGQGLLIENKNQLQFIHDKVQEAALSAIPEERRRRIHSQVGEHLLSAVPLSASMEGVSNLFTIVSHLNRGRAERPEAEAAYRLSDLNHHAGNKALNSLATEAANEYFRMSLELLPEDRWEDPHYEGTYRIYQKAAKTELMCGNYEGSERLLDQLLTNARTELDKAECLAEQTMSLSSIGNFIKAIETANRGLAFFDRAIPGSAEEADRRRQELMDAIGSKGGDIWRTILDMPFTTDRRSKIELAFYSELIPDLYMSGLVPQLYLSAAQSTWHCLAGGMDESVIYSFSIMGLQLGERGDYDKAFRYEDLARDLSAKYPNTFGAAKGMNGIVWCNMHSRSRPREIVDYCIRAIQCGKNCGDLYNAGLSYGPLMWNLQVEGADLSAIEDLAEECLQFSRRYRLSFSVGLAEAVQAGWIGPMKELPPIPMEEKVRQWEENNHIASAGSYYAHRALAHFYRGEHEDAGRCLAEVRKYLSGLTDNVLKRQWYVFRALNGIRLFEKEGGSREEMLDEVRPIIEKVEEWAALGPLLRPYLAYVRAELERVDGDAREARGLYLDAIASAHEHNYTLLEGHLNERFGKFMEDTGSGPSRAYFKEAARLYRECHAERLRERLMKERPLCFEETAISPPRAEVTPAVSILPDLDVEYLMKASLAISAEMEQDVLLKKILNVVMESSGAQHGCMIVEREGKLFVRTESHGREETMRMSNRRLEDSDDICRAIVRYVHRTGEQVTLGNAMHEGPFKDNLEVHDLQLRSVLCLPVVKQSKTVAVLYLENRLSENVFTSVKKGMTEMLASHAAVSLENAALFEERLRSEEELRRTGEALRKSEQRWATTLASIGDAVIAADTAGMITFMNAVAEELTGWTLEEASRRPVDEVFRIINEHDRGTVEDPVAKVLETGVKATLANHTLLVRKDLTEVPIDDSGAPIWDKDGRMIGVVLVFRDVTDRKRKDEALLKAKNEWERTFDHIPDLIAILNNDHRIMRANKAMLERLGAEDLDSCPDLKCYLCVHGTDRPPAFCPHSMTVADGKEHVAEVREERLGGDFLVSTTPILDPRGRIVGTVHVARDITERKMMEEELREKAENLARSNAELQQFAYVASHDLQEPLRMVTSHLSLLERKYGDKLDEGARENLRFAIDGGIRAKALIRDLLDYSRVDSRAQPLKLLNMEDAMAIVRANLKVQIEEEGATVMHGPLPSVMAEENQMIALLQNLVNNGIKFHGRDPPVVSVQCRRDGHNWLFSVKDNGIGIDPQYHENLFQLFKRLHTVDQYPGTGIGLALAKKITERHGGRIWMESEPGSGTTFYFTLPIRDADE
ncbi:MAG: AAA family ATPase [Methanomassiliicoccus sp.]|nr:AAA family ATPase [Methanomassiliicoccus sp.]